MALVVASCGGAGGDSGCGGMAPLPGGFPQEDVVPNAGSLRLTRAGLDFLAANLGPVAASALGTTEGQLQFDIPKASQSISTFGIEACSNPGASQCVADVDLGAATFHVDAVAPDAVSVDATIPVVAADIPVVASGPFGINLTFDVGIGAGSCLNGKPQVTPTSVPVSMAIPLVAEAQTPRAGYTKIDWATAAVVPNIDPNTIQICGSGVSGLFAGILSDFKSFVLGLVASPLASALKGQLGAQFCQKPNTTVSPPCPTGSAPTGDGSRCLFSSGAEQGLCVPMLLGTEGRIDLGALLSTITPGASGGLDVVLAAGGSAHPTPGCTAGQTWTASGGCTSGLAVPYPAYTPNGITLGVLGGALPSPPSNCVVAVQNPLPQGIPIPDELLADSVSSWPSSDDGPDVGLALAGRFLDYVGASAYNAGALCLGISTDQVQALSTGLVSAIIPSVKDLTFEPGTDSQPAAVAITTRPSRPPSFAIGGGTDLKTDPLLTVKLPQFAVDFYVWSYDRYVRVFTYTADLSVPVDLQTGKDPTTNPSGGILPVLGDVTATNSSVTNSQLLTDDPQTIASALTSLIGGLVGQFLGSGLPPIDLSSALSSFGLGLNIPSDGFRKLTTGSDEFVGLFADLTAGAGIMAMTVHPQAALAGLTVNRQAMTLETATRSELPKLSLTMSAPEDDGTRPVEYSFWIDAQPHSAWQTSSDAIVDSEYLFFQGKHILSVTARVVGHPETEGTSPAQVPFVIDVIPPTVWLVETDKGYAGRGFDFVSAPAALQARYREKQGAPWSAWQPLAALQSFLTDSVDLQVKDEAGNVGETNALIRGADDQTILAAGRACGCSTPGKAAPSQAALAAVLASVTAIVLLARRRQASPVILGSLGILASTTQGCSCGTNRDGGTGCGEACGQPCGKPDQPGLIGSYTSVAVAGDGTIWVAGYDDADVTTGLLYGDLVVGKYDPSARRVGWQTVDGLPPPPPAGSCPPNDPSTWRDGLTDPGPDVGLWTSIQVDANGSPMVSYYDATNQALKFASSPDGGHTWATHTVMQAPSSDIGRYSKMLPLNGVPTVGFLVVEPGSGGWARSRVVLATAKVASPQSASDWSFEDAMVDAQTPCRAEFCGTGEVCVQETMLCQPTVSGCTPSDCGASTAGIGSSTLSCVTVSGVPTCEMIDGPNYVDSYPDAEGDYVTMASGPHGLGIVVYDRTRGNLVGAANVNGAWTALVLDGQAGSNTDPTGVDTGDVGIAASLTITSEGDWHISYVNGWTKTLQYLLVPGGSLTQLLTPEVVDDGTQLGGQPFPDGLHLVGDDSSITVDGATVRIVYQDASAGTLREALGAAGPGKLHTWTLAALAQPSKFAGFFPHFVAGADSIENWYRETDTSQSPPLVTGNVAFLAP